MAAQLKLVSFTPNPKLSPTSNLKALVKYCREKLTLLSDREGFKWHASIWPDPSRNTQIRFTNLSNSKLHSSASPSEEQILHPAFIDVAKSYLRYWHSTKPHHNAARELQALRALEKALKDDLGIPDITKIHVRHFNAANELLEDFVARAAIVTSAIQILSWLSEKGVVPAEVIRWQNPYIKDKSYHSLRGANAPADVKESKSANQDAFLSIADVFSQPLTQLDDSDIMVTSITALLLSAPIRIGETIRWRTDCLRSDHDKNGDLQRYLAYYIPKTRSYTRKAVPTQMSEVAQEAVDRLVSITAEGRKLALYMEGNPTKFYRHADCPDVADDQELTRDQVAQALGFAHRKSCEDFIKSHTGKYSLKGFTLNSLWELVLAEHKHKNPHFPYQERPQPELMPLKMSESLMCFRRLQLGVRAGTSPVLLAPFNPDYYRKRLDGGVKTDRKNQRPLCFFTKHGLAPHRLNSHSLRHFLNRLADQYGVSVEEITEWSGRASKQQTHTYLHETAEQKLDKASTLMQTKQEHETLQPVTEDEAAKYGRGPYHRSRYGICRRSWRAGPCIKFADCTNCSELLACKGDKVALEAIKIDLCNITRTRDAAQQAIDAGERSASLWLEKSDHQQQRLIALVDVMENPNIPDGSPIQITGTDFSHESRIVGEKAKVAGVELVQKEQLGRDHGPDLLQCLEMLLQ
jgi:hypothetical protein